MTSSDETVALVTGAGRGIGRAVAERLARQGVSIALNDYKPDPAALEGALEAIAAHGVRVRVVEADVSQASDVSSMVDEIISEFGRIDILVNNAGMARVGPIEMLSEDDWDRTLGVNLKGQFLVSRAVVPHMKERASGAIVNTASELGLIGQPNLSPYVAAKAGAIGLTKALARELAPFGIRVNCVAPGPTDTQLLGDDERTPEYVASIPLGRLGRPEDIASAVWFLASSESAWITGQVLSPNGGVVI